MSRFTKRPLNLCHGCGYNWYPRGRSVSHKCPRCGSTNVETASAAAYRAFVQSFTQFMQFVGRALRGIGSGIAAGWRAIAGNAQAQQKPISAQPAAPPTPVPQSRPQTPSPRPLQSRTQRFTTAVSNGFRWVTSVGADLTGLNPNARPGTIAAKLLVIVCAALTTFALLIRLAHRLGLL
jgi:predicted RNA-binding Zn-ribbon protein involved in translation (DUF1610 family)